MALGIESPHNVVRTTITTLVVVVIGIVTLWQYPGAELILFHAVWIALALVMLRTSPSRTHVWILVAFVVGLAVIVAVDDLRTHYEELDTLVELFLDLPAFVAVIVLARRQRRFLVAEREAAVAEQLRNIRQRAFFSNASHALRTPLTVARGHTELALQATTDPEVRADLIVVLEEIDRLTRAAERNLRLSIAGEVDHQQLQPVDVHELARTTVERWRPAAHRAWSAVATGPDCEILVDPEQLTEAMDAVIENAVLATTEGGSIVVRSEVDSDSIVLSVTDDGCGFGESEPIQLFEPFEQGPNQSPLAPRGTGLGLAVVRAIAIAHGGSAQMENDHDSGTVVRITLPRSKDKSPASNPQVKV